MQDSVLSDGEVNFLRQAGERALHARGVAEEHASFVWRGEDYVVTRRFFSVRVETSTGIAVVTA